MHLHLTSIRLKTLSEIFVDVGQAIFISTIIPFAFSIDSVPILGVVSGWILSAVSWLLALYILN